MDKIIKKFENFTYLEGDDYSKGYYSGIQAVLKELKNLVKKNENKSV